MPAHHAVVSFCPRRQLLFGAVDARTGIVHHLPALRAAAASGSTDADQTRNQQTAPHCTFGAPGHDIIAMVHDPYRDAVYSCGKDHTLRAWNFKTGGQKWSWSDTNPYEVLSKTFGETRLFACKVSVAAAGPRRLNCFHPCTTKLYCSMVLATGQGQTIACDSQHGWILAVLPGRRNSSNPIAELTAFNMNKDPKLRRPLWRRCHADGVAVVRLEMAAQGQSRNSGGVAVALLAESSPTGTQMVGYRLSDGWPIWQVPASTVGKMEIRADILLTYNSVAHAVDIRTVLDGCPAWQLETTGRRPDVAAVPAFTRGHASAIGNSSYDVGKHDKLERHANAGEGKQLRALRARKLEPIVQQTGFASVGGPPTNIANTLASSWTAVWRNEITGLVTLFVLDETMIRAVDTSSRITVWAAQIPSVAAKGQKYLPSISIAGNMLCVAVQGKVIAMSPVNGKELWAADSEVVSNQSFALHPGRAARLLGIKDSTKHELAIFDAVTGRSLITLKTAQHATDKDAQAVSSWAFCRRGIVCLEGQTAIYLVPKAGGKKRAWTVVAKETEEFLVLCAEERQEQIFVLCSTGPHNYRVHVLNLDGRRTRFFNLHITMEPGCHRPHMHSCRNRLMFAADDNSVKRFKFSAVDSATGEIAWNLRTGSVKDKLPEAAKLIGMADGVAVFVKTLKPTANSFDGEVFGVCVEDGQLLWRLRSSDKSWAESLLTVQNILTQLAAHGPIAAWQHGCIVVTKYHRAKSSSGAALHIFYHIRALHPDEGRELSLGGQLWQYPCVAETGSVRRFSCLTTTEKTIFAGSTDGVIHAVSHATGTPIMKVDSLHVNPVTELAICGKSLWSASANLAVLHIVPLEVFGSVSALKSGYSPVDINGSTIKRQKALYGNVSAFFLAMVFLILDCVQFIKFSHETVQSAASKQLDSIIAFVALFGFEAKSYEVFKSMHIASVTTIFIFILIIAVQEKAEWKAFLHPKDRLYTTVWLCCSIYVQFVGQPLFLPIASNLVQSFDCKACSCMVGVNGTCETNTTGHTVYANDCPAGSYRLDIGSDANAASPDSSLTEYVLCYDRYHLFILLSSAIALLFYIPFCVRLLRVGGRLACIEIKSYAGVLLPWWFPLWQEDDSVNFPCLHPLSDHSGTHKVLTVLCKITALSATTMIRDRSLMLGLLCGIALIRFTATSIPSFSPFHGRRANGVAAGLDMAVLCSCVFIFITNYVCAAETQSSCVQQMYWWLVPNFVLGYVWRAFLIPTCEAVVTRCTQRRIGARVAVVEDPTTAADP